MRSSRGCALARAVSAPAASLASSAFTTFLTAVRSIERWATLRALRTTVCLARFLADLMLATREILVGRSPERRGLGRKDRKLWAIQWLGSTRPAQAGRGQGGHERNSRERAGDQAPEHGSRHPVLRRDDHAQPGVRAGARYQLQCRIR